MAAIAVTLCVYFGLHVVGIFHDTYDTVRVFQYVASDSVEVEGVLIREEQVLTNTEGILDVARVEGEKVGVGQTIALVHRDSVAKEDQAQLEAMEREISLLDLVVQESSTNGAGMDEDILRALVSLRSSTALEDYSSLEDQVKRVKANVLKRGYIHGDAATAETITNRLRELKSKYLRLSANTAAATRKITAQQAGTFSNLVDGYEGVLTPQMAKSLTPSALKQAMNSPSTPTGAMGKLITSERWYYAVNMNKDQAARLTQGGTALLRFAGNFNVELNTKVEHISAAEEGLVTVVFSGNRYLSQTTLLRRQSAELVFDSWSGLRVPKEAVHMEKISQVDEETQIETFTTRLGVYVLMGGRAEFKGVEIVTEGSDYYVVRSTTAGSKTLRAGDEVIINAVGLTNGQLLEF